MYSNYTSDGMASCISPKTCILHIDKPTSDDVKSFTEETWNKVIYFQNQRREVLKTSKLFAIHLPEKYYESMGYHLRCYKAFSAVPKCKSDTDTVESSLPRLTRSDSGFAPEHISGIFPKVCIICNATLKSQGRYKPKEQLGGCEVISSACGIKEAAITLNDYKLLAKIADLDLIAKEVKYHHSCKNSYTKQAQRAKSIKLTSVNEKSQSHTAAFDELKTFIQKHLVESPGAKPLTLLHQMNISHLKDDESTYTAQSLQEKVLKSFPSLQVTKVSNTQGVVIYNEALSAGDAVSLAYYNGSKIKKTALYLRSIIMQTMNNQSC